MCDSTPINACEILGLAYRERWTFTQFFSGKDFMRLEENINIREGITMPEKHIIICGALVGMAGGVITLAVLPAVARIILRFIGG